MILQDTCGYLAPLLLSSCYLHHQVAAETIASDSGTSDSGTIAPTSDAATPDSCDPPTELHWVRNNCPFCNGLHYSQLRVCDDMVIEAAGPFVRTFRFDPCTDRLNELVCLRLDTGSGCGDGCSPVST